MTSAALRTLPIGALVLALDLALACAPKQSASTPPEPLTAPLPPLEPEPETEADTREPVDWAGDVAVPGAPLRMIVHLEPAEGDAWKGTLDLPQSGLRGHPLRDVEVTDEGFDVVLAPEGTPEARWVFVAIEHKAGADEGVGTFEQAGQSFPVKLRRLAPGEEYSPPRPQTPKEPYPYGVREIELVQGEVQLACTMVVPDGDATYPAVALLSGSGAQDRDSTIFEHRPFAVLADHLARNAIASLRCDDRGIGGSTGAYREATHEMLRDDALAMVLALAGDARIRPGAIGIIGHSEGGMVAPMAAAKAPESVAFIVLLAGPGLPGATILGQQSRDLAQAQGRAPEALDREAKAHKAVIKAIVDGAPRDTLADKLRALVELQTADGQADDATRSAIVDQSLEQMTSPWFASFVKTDPRASLRKLKKTPVLALGGSLDLQVRADENLGVIKKALAKARDKDVTTETFAGLNHLFQPALTGTVEEYGTIETTIAPEVLERISAWINARFGAP